MNSKRLIHFFLLTVIVALFLAWLKSHLADRAAAATIGNAVQNSVGSFEQAVAAGLASHPLQATLPGISPAAAAGVQYVLNNAGPELARFETSVPDWRHQTGQAARDHEGPPARSAAGPARRGWAAGESGRLDRADRRPMHSTGGATRRRDPPRASRPRQAGGRRI